MKLFSWNIAGRLSSLNKQIDYLFNGAFDIICLQEVISKTQGVITKKLKNLEYNTINSVPIEKLSTTGRHKYNLLIFSKAEIIKNKP